MSKFNFYHGDQGNRYLGIERLIPYIHQHTREPISLSHLADLAGYSPRQLIRIFKERIGLSPMYYVSSLRLQTAKDLLVRTDLTIRDIGLEIGQQSLGTFTTRFTERVGVTPSQFRNSALEADLCVRSLRRLANRGTLDVAINEHSVVQGTVDAAEPLNGFILIGMFATPIPELYGTLLLSPGTFCFSGVKPGVYHLMATSVNWEMRPIEYLMPLTTARVKLEQPILIDRIPTIRDKLRLILRLPRLDDPPILSSIPLLMKRYLEIVEKNGNL